MAAPVETRAPPTSDDIASDSRRVAGCRPAVVLLVLAAVLFLGFAARIIPAPFGDSHDGRNAGVWAAGSRNLREHGPVASRLGTHSPENGVYANHPPLLYVETALFEAVAGDSPAASRAPAWIGTLTVLALLTALLLQAGLRPSAVGAAVVLVAATPMLLVYGAMLDTPVTSLPFGLALLLVWERTRMGKRVPWSLAAGLAALAVMSGWQSLMLAAAVGGWALVRLARRSGSRALNVAFAGGALSGAVLLTGWLLWAFDGSLAPLFDQFRLRTGQTTPVPLHAVIDAIRHDRATMFGVPALLALVGLVAAAADRRTRGLVALAAAVTLPYPLVFRSGAVNHDYWNFWFLVPVAIGLAAGCDRLLRPRSIVARYRAVMPATAAASAIVLTVVLWARPDAASWVIQDGRRAGSVATGQSLDPGQRSAWYAGAVGKPAAWLGLATGRPAVSVPVADLNSLAAAHPQDLVMVGRMRCVNGEPHIAYAFERAAGLAAHPPETDRCRPPGAGVG